MAIKTTSGNTLSQSYFMRTFYNNKKTAISSDKRKNVEACELSHDDITALHRAVRKLASFDYEKDAPKDDNNNSSITNAVQAFVDIYNNTLSSGAKTEDPDLKQYVKKLQKISKTNKEDLAKMGIDIQNNGTLKVKSSMLVSVDKEKINNALSTKENSYLKDMIRVVRKFENKSTQLMYSSVTGNGSSINTSV